MSHPAEPSRPVQAPASAEPTVGSAAVPVWMVILPVLVLFGGALYFDWHGGWFNASVQPPYTSLAEVQRYQPVDTGDPTLRGKAVFENVCALCHGVDGAGKPGQAPTFHQSEWVLSDNVGLLIRIPLHGLTGPITVQGEEWNLNMAAMGAALSDEDLAAVLSYMRNAWGNEASFITPEQVAAVRAETKGRTQPWTVSELQALP